MSEQESTLTVGSFGEAPSPVVLRPIADRDEGFLRDLYASTRRAELSVVPWSPEAKRAFCDSQYTAQDLYYRATYPHARFDVVELGGARVGRLLVDLGAEEAHVLDITIAEAMRSRGLGTMLMLWVLDVARRRRVGVRLNVDLSSPAQRLYERLGFRAVAADAIRVDMRWEPWAVDEPCRPSTCAAGR